MATNAHKGNMARTSSGQFQRNRGWFFNPAGQLVLPSDYVYIPYRTGWTEPTGRYVLRSGSSATMTMAENLGPNGYGLHMGPQDFNRIPFVTNNNDNAFFGGGIGNWTASSNTQLLCVATTWGKQGGDVNKNYYNLMQQDISGPSGIVQSGLAVTSVATSGDNFANLRLNGTVQDANYGMPAGTYYFTGFYRYSGNKYIGANSSAAERLVFVCNSANNAGLASMTTVQAVYGNKTAFQWNGHADNAVYGSAGWRYVELPFIVTDNNGINIRLQAPKNTYEPIIWSDLGVWSTPGRVPNGVSPRDTHATGKMYYDGRMFGSHEGYIGLWLQPLSFDAYEFLWTLGYSGRLQLGHGVNAGTGKPFIELYALAIGNAQSKTVRIDAASATAGWGGDYLSRKPIHLGVLYRKNGSDNQIRLIINGGEEDSGWVNAHTARGPSGELIDNSADFVLGEGYDTGYVVSDLVVGRSIHEYGNRAIYLATKPLGAGIWEPQRVAVGAHFYT